MNRILVGIVTPGSIRWECSWSLDAARAAGCFEELRFQESGPYVDNARNRLVERFLDTDCDRLLMVDSDISFLPADITRLADDDLDVVSGVYYNFFDGVLTPVLKLLPDTPAADEPLLEVAGTGAGFLMISRSLLEKMAPVYGQPCPWFFEPIRDGDHMGEDMEFCARAREMGVGVYIDLRVQLGHYKTVRISPPTLD
ncbi:MAG TPA: hypothetical protein VMU09_04080 [Acidimicrobiales bacterium]|nr:hypothetical protein [Acidimicrobiales bacterium]